MSGDVQPRKRKDKKKKKDELGVEEPRGTAAALGDGDVFIHSQQDHGTGGHWCAKIIFFSLLAVLVTLIGLIILENRGLSELEAKAVQSQYSGVLEGWLEDAPDDDHHDEHTLDLKHHDDDDGDEEHNVEESDHEDEEDHESDHEDEEDHDEDESDHEDEEDDENLESREEEEDQEESVEDQTEADEDDDENIPSNEVYSNEEQDADNDDDQSEENLQDNEDGEGEIRYKRYYYGEKYDDDEDNDEYEPNFEDDQDDEEDAKQDHDEDDENDENYESDEDDQNDKNDHSDEDAQNDDEDDQHDEEDDQNVEEDNHNEENYGNYPNADDNDQNFQYDLDDDSTEIINQDTNGKNDDSYEQKDEEDNEEDQEQEDKIEEDADDEEIEKIEKEVVDDDADTDEAAGNRDADDDDFDASREDEDREAGDDDDALEEQDVDDDEPPLERITAPPAGKPFVEIEEEVTEKPVNTLAEEEEYERRQEQLRKEQEEEAAQGSQTWVKLAVGGALLVATHAVLRRATAGPRDVPEPEEHVREETPTVDRRMTLIPEQHSPRVQQESPVTQITPEIEEEVFKKPAPIAKSAPIVKQDSEEEVIVKKTPVEEKTAVVDTKDADKELYSEEEEEDEEYEEEEDIEEPVKEVVQKKAPPVAETKPTEESEPEDVEIIDDEQIEEELEDEEDEDEEEISDVDDTELLSRLEAKYGRMPEPERYGSKPERFGPIHKDGGNSIEDDWPGEPSDAYWRTELNIAEEELRQGAWSACEKRASAAALAGSARARYLAARALDHAAEAQRDNRLLGRAIAAYLHLLKMNERLSDRRLLEVAHRAIDRIQFRGTYLNAEPIYRLLIRRFPDDVNFRNNLTVSFLMANRPDLADEVLKETLRLWPDDRVALAHHGFVLKNQYNKLEEAVDVLYKALEGDTGPANEPRFYYHLGDALLLLGRFEEAHEVHKRGAALGHFLSPAQRSLYNVPRLKSKPWWSVEETPYVNLARALERSWREILKEGEAAKALYEKEKEGLKERGEWSQLDLFVRGAELPGRCARAPVTCAIVRGEAAAAGCRRGQVKFSLMAAGTHVRPHVGPTNCRLRMHLGLSNTKDTYIRVNKETRQWQTGKTLIFDDSFEHEVWHNGTGARLVLIVDVWHPELSARERRSLPAI